MKKIIAAALSSFLLAGAALAQAPAQPVAPAVVGRVITEPAEPAAAHKAPVKKHAKAVKKAVVKKGKKAVGGARKVSATHHKATAAHAAKASPKVKAKKTHAKVH